jgi:hypothetical protein
MFKHRIGYRHLDSKVEGFIADVADENTGEKACIEKVMEQCAARNQPFDPSRLIRSFGQVNSEEAATMQADWKLKECQH